MAYRSNKKTEAKQRELIEQGCDRLRLAICEQAIRDYKSALKKGNTQMKDECERFFRSGWYKMLMDVDGELVIFGIGKKVAEELYVANLSDMEQAVSFTTWEYFCENDGIKTSVKEGEGDTAIYLTYEEYEYKDKKYLSSPIYHVWVRGKSVTVTQDYTYATNKYNKRLKQVQKKLEVNANG